MPRYFFDVRDSESASRDEAGLDLPDDGAARAHADALLSRAVQRSPPDGWPHAFECIARDGAGAVVYRSETLFRGTPR